MPRTVDQLPQFLRQYCIEHDTSRYSHRDHAAWRYIMRRALPFFREHAVAGYEQGLAKTGLSIDRIPHIDEIDQKLQTFGWGAVPVCGFIPPWAFLEFQARQILPIATDMRQVEHIAYTPAPDIVHEAAGHAPILPDTDYNRYLSYYASLGTKAIYSRDDLDLYEAIRVLSDTKEKPESRPEDITQAERALEEAKRRCTYVSEATKVGRMSWWTAEYGLAGNLQQPKIYGAGLLSSVGESKLAMTDQVQKIPLSIDCTNYGYDITEPQPQLFVAQDMQHLHDVLHELDASLSYRIGGIRSLQLAKESRAVTTTVLDSHLAISGRLVDFRCDRHGELSFIKYAGPCQLSVNEQQLPDHGIERHPSGYSSPLGRWSLDPSRAPQHFSRIDIERKFGLRCGQRVKLRYTSGIELTGILVRILDHQGQMQLMTFKDCLLRHGDERLFDPSWGEFDLALGESVPSVYGGPADRELFGEQEIEQTKSTPGRDSPYTRSELELFELYGKLRWLRNNGANGGTQQELAKLVQTVL